MYKYNFHELFSLSTNTSYFEGLLHTFKSDKDGKIRLQFLLDNNLRVSTQGKPNINMMLYHNAQDNSIEFSYPWIVPVVAKLVFADDYLSYTFSFNKNYLRFSKIVAEGWELIDVFRSLIQISLIKAGMYMVHGAAVSLGDEGILVPSFGNTGKTMTSWMLAKRGAEFLTDEFAILDSQGNCYGFPCSSLVSGPLVEAAELRLTRKQGLSLWLRELMSKVLSTRFAHGGIKLYPDQIFKTRDEAAITRIVFIQKGLDDIRTVDPDEVITLLTAVQDYEMNWRANPYIIAQSFFRPDFNSRGLSSNEAEIMRSIVSRAKAAYLVSSSNGSHFEFIEKIAKVQILGP